MGTQTTQSTLQRDTVVMKSSFNMCGYAAPKIEKVRIGFVGLGHRGPAAVNRISFIDGVEIKALCDKVPGRVDAAQKILSGKGLPAAKAYTGEDGWKAMCESSDLDLIYICTPWSLHTPMAIYAMKHGKHAASEVPIAVTIDECWQLVETSEKTRKHCMMLEMRWTQARCKPAYPASMHWAIASASTGSAAAISNRLPGRRARWRPPSWASRRHPMSTGRRWCASRPPAGR